MYAVLSEVTIAQLIRYIVYEFWSSLLPLMCFPPLRSFWLRVGGAHIGRGTIINKISLVNLYAHGLGNLSIGDKCFVGDEVMLDLSGKVILGDHVTLALRAVVVTHMNVGFRDHPLKSRYPKMVEKVLVRRGSFVGANATILPGVTVGEEALVAAGSVVVDDVETRSCVAGVPAKVYKRL